MAAILAFTGPSIEAYMPVIGRVIAARTSTLPQQPQVQYSPQHAQQITFAAAGWDFGWVQGHQAAD